MVKAFTEAGGRQALGGQSLYKARLTPRTRVRLAGVGGGLRCGWPGDALSGRGGGAPPGCCQQGPKRASGRREEPGVEGRAGIFSAFCKEADHSVIR